MNYGREFLSCLEWSMTIDYARLKLANDVTGSILKTALADFDRGRASGGA